MTYTYLYSYYFVTLPFSWKFRFDKLSKYDKLRSNNFVHSIWYANIAQNASDIIAEYIVHINIAKLKYS